MVVSNTNKPHSLPQLAPFITIFLFLLNRVHSLKTDETYFFFDRFEADQVNLIQKGSATINASEKLLQLTSIDSKIQASQALYSAPFHLWDNPSNVASFESNFSFFIESSSENPNTPADGFTFFISSINISSGGPGGLLGLFPNDKGDEEEAKSNKIVAIEFDTFSDAELGDPSYKHIGIDVNSIRSKVTTEWGWKKGGVGNAQINYNPSTKKLTVLSDYYTDYSSDRVSLSYEVELSKILPQYVQVGFSASTGIFQELTNIISWSFGSSLKLSEVKKGDQYLAN